jgi:transcriptional regulator with PAS, ATPase and Fis domain
MIRLGAHSASTTSGAKLTWLLSARLGVLVLAMISVLGSLALLESEHHRAALGLFFPLGIFLLIGLGSWWWLKAHRASATFTAAQVSLDILLVTGIIYVTGGPISPFLFLYLPLVMAAALLLSRGAALTAAAVSAVSYVCLATAMKTGWLGTYTGTEAVQVPSGGLLLQSIGLCSAMVLIAVATSYLVQTISKRDASVEESKRDLERGLTRQKELIQSIPEAICVVDKSGKVSSANASALHLLQKTEEQTVGKGLLSVLQTLSPDFAFEHSSDEFYGEISFQRAGMGDPTCIRVHGRLLPSASLENGETGYLVVLNDLTILRSIEEQLELQDRMARLLSSTNEPPSSLPRKLGDFIGESVVMQKVFSLIQRVARSDATVLVNGASGTGKELVARAIHQESLRARGCFVAVNCGAIPETLLESEFFGHKKGSFTGAQADHPGLFQRASGGTLFLDEIGELPVLMQAKLLRAIQERSIRPVGGERDVAVDVRIVAATNRNLRREIEAGNFREDLYYRLNVISISLPPLKERKDDIPLLVNAILQRLLKNSPNADSEEPPTAVIPPQTMQLLVNYSYPGNVRELENIIERAFVLGGSVILPEHLPEAVRSSPSELIPIGEKHARGETQIIIDESIQFPVDLDTVLGVIERRYLEGALSQTGGAKKKAAELLGINFRSFRYRLQKFGLSDSEV